MALPRFRGKPKDDYGNRNADSEGVSSTRKLKSKRCDAQREAERIDKNWQQFFDIRKTFPT
jgi:hypothetical protein